jgi:hypothetical protein
MRQGTKKTERENVAGSVQQSPGRTGGRTRQEKRVGSGNTRREQAPSEDKINRPASSRPSSTKNPSSR